MTLDLGALSALWKCLQVTGQLVPLLHPDIWAIVIFSKGALYSLHTECFPQTSYLALSLQDVCKIHSVCVCKSTHLSVCHFPVYFISARIQSRTLLFLIISQPLRSTLFSEVFKNETYQINEKQSGCRLKCEDDTVINSPEISVFAISKAFSLLCSKSNVDYQGGVFIAQGRHGQGSLYLPCYTTNKGSKVYHDKRRECWELSRDH